MVTNLVTARTTPKIDDVLSTEFPVINGEYQGRRNNLIMMPQGGFEEPRFPGLVKIQSRHRWLSGVEPGTGLPLQRA
jgi:hypothetical protein